MVDRVQDGELGAEGGFPASMLGVPGDSIHASKCLALGKIAEEIQESLMRGREPDVDGLVREYPEIESEIRQLVPTLLLLAEVGRRPWAEDGAPSDGAGMGAAAPGDGGVAATEPLGDFRIVREVARGGMGIVYEAVQLSLGRRVALKVLPFASVLDPRQVERFKNEAHAAASLHHTHIVPVYATGCERGVHYYAMQYIEGQSLAAAIEELKDAKRRTLDAVGGPGVAGSPAAAIPAAESGERTPSSSLPRGRALFRAAARLGVQAAGALHAAHEVGIVHRDVKPSNLLLDVRGDLWVTDFGLARAQMDSGLTLSGDILGTLRYMSPEQALGRRGAVDARSDVYSLGATLYELLTLEPAVRGKDRQEILERIAFAEPSHPSRLVPEIPRDLDTIVLKAIAKEPDLRYATAEALADDLRRFLEDRPIQARRPGPLRRVAKWVRRHKAPTMAILAMLLAATVIGGAIIGERAAAREAAYRALVLRAVESLALGDSSLRFGGSRVAAPLEDRAMILGSGSVAAGVRSRQRVEAALADLERAASIFPSRPDARYHRSRGLIIIGREREALAEISSLLDEAPDFEPARTLRSTILEKTGDGGLPSRGSGRPSAGRAGSSGAWLEARRAVSERRFLDAAGAYTRLLAGTGEREPYLGFSLEARLARGIAFLEAGDHDAAIRDFAAACDRWPRALGPAMLLGQAYLLKGEDRAAERWLEAFYEASELKDEVAIEAAWMLDRVGSEGRGGEEALRWLDKVGDPCLREKARMKVLADLWHYPEAAEAGERALSCDPGDARTCALLACSYAEIPGKADRAPGYLEKARRLDPDDPLVLLVDAEFLADAGRYAEAIAPLDRASHLAPETRAIEWSLACAHLSAGHYEEARRRAEALLARDPRDAWAHWILGSVHRFLGDRERAAEHLERAVALKPEHSNPARTWLAGLHASFGDWAAAEAVYRETLDVFPQDRWARWMYAQRLQARGRFDEALRNYCEALAEAPRASREGAVQSHLADLLRGRPRPLDLTPLDAFVVAQAAHYSDVELGPVALEAFALALTHAPTCRDLERARRCAVRAVEATARGRADPLSTLATVEWARGDRPEAVRILEEALELPDAETGHREQLEEYRRDLLPLVASFASADGALSGKRTELRGETEDIQEYLRACTLLRAGDPRGARAIFEALSARDSGAVEPTLQVASCLEAEGDGEEAERALRVAIEGRAEPSRRLWEEWWLLVGTRLGLRSEEALARLPVQGPAPKALTGASDFPDDLAWALGRTVGGESLRIDCGAEADSVGAGGRHWSRDRCYRGGWIPGGGATSLDCLFADDGPVRGTDEESLYRTERRFDRGSLHSGYRIPLPPGRYRVTLHFVEVWMRSRSPWPYDVTVEGEKVLAGYQPFDAGFAAADRHTVVTTVEDGFLDVGLAFAQSDDPPDLSRDPPKISGIEVERADGPR